MRPLRYMSDIKRGGAVTPLYNINEWTQCPQMLGISSHGIHTVPGKIFNCLELKRRSHMINPMRHNCPR